MTHHYNIVLLCLDSVRKDFFDEFAPRIRSHADLSFEQCRAASSWSTPSHASMISGKLPSEHDIHTYNRNFKGLSKDNTLFGDLNEHTSFGASANTYASSVYGFDEYFDEYSDISRHQLFLKGLSPSEIRANIDSTGVRRYFDTITTLIRHDHSMHSLLNGIIAKMETLSDIMPFLPQLFDDGGKAVLRQSRQQIDTMEEPFVAFYNLMDGHIPHRPVVSYNRNIYSNVPNNWSSDEYGVWELFDSENKEEYWNKREQVYAAVIDYLDRKITRYMKEIQDVTNHDTTFVITSDHGENHGRESEGGLANHKSSLSEALIHVPLEIVNPPDQVLAEMNSMQNQLVSHLELRQFLRSIGKGDVPDFNEWRKTAPAEVIGMSPGPDPSNQYDYWDRAIRSCVRNEEKITWDSKGKTVRYDVDTSKPSWQSKDTELSTVPAWASEQFPTDIVEYEHRAEQMDSKVVLADSTKARLKELGYR